MTEKHDPGGKVRFPKPANWESYAMWNGERSEYRTLLSYTWNPRGPRLLAAMMNPSVADENVLDPTLAKIGRLSKRWGYGGFAVVNVCDYRCTDSRLLRKVEKPCSENNLEVCDYAAHNCYDILVGYGKLHKSLKPYADAMVAVLRATGRRIYVLGLNKDGSPRHPLYAKETDAWGALQLWS